MQKEALVSPTFSHTRTRAYGDQHLHGPFSASSLFSQPMVVLLCPPRKTWWWLVGEEQEKAEV